jgi:ribose transport system ATP-binding protein
VRSGRLVKRLEVEAFARWASALRIRARSPNQPAHDLSGGNQQKVVIGKWLERNPRLLILDEPTRGVDVGAKVEIYEIMNRLAAAGTAILMISSDLPEVLGMSDRIVVMHEGRVTGEFPRAEATKERVMQAAIA